MTLPFQEGSRDFVSFLLSGNSLLQQETEFRAILADLKQDAVEESHEPLAFLGAVLGAGGVRGVAVWRILAILRKQPVSLLREAAVAFVNGTHWIVPEGKGVTVLSATDMQPVDACPPAIVATVYHLREMFTIVETAKETFKERQEK